MKSLLDLIRQVLTDVGTWCGVDTARDYKYIASRTDHEGLPFLSVRLASFGKDLEKVLRQGYVDDNMFAGFRQRAGLPELFKGFLHRVVSPDGVVLPDADTDCIFAIRQVTLLCEKIRVDYSEQIVDNAINSYLESERNVRSLDRKIQSGVMEQELALFKRVSMILWADVLSRTEQDLLNGDLVPRHGPGKTADRVHGNSKWAQLTWPERLEEWFPHQEFLVPNLRYWREATEHVTFLSPRSEIPVRVVTVPKTVSKARLIAIEPTAMQYCQQALDRSLRKHLKSVKARGFVTLSDQLPNQEAARLGSLTGELATLDLSAASDSLSNQLVIEMLWAFPQLSAAVQACRSRLADVRGDTIRVAKFASMGSALCFPIETMVFVTLAVMGSLREIGQSSYDTVTEGQVYRLLGKVRSYGDDIIVASDQAPTVMRWLEAFGFQVNEDKSYWTGRFRESCGKDYYGGTDVSVVRVRELISTSPRSADVISTVSLRNLMYFRGMWHTAKWLDAQLSSGLGHYPTVFSTSAILGRYSLLSYETERVEKASQAPEVRGYVVNSTIPDIPLDGVWALMKILCRPTSPEEEDVFSFLDDVTLAPDHLVKSGRPSVVNTKLKWHSPF